MKTKEKLQEELIKILQSFVPNLQNDEYNKLKIELAELKEEEPKQSAEIILNKHLKKINATKDIYNPKEWILFLKAMEEYRQQGMPTEEEIRDAGQQSCATDNEWKGFTKGAKWMINKWKGDK